MSEKIDVQNFTSPDHVYRVDKAKYLAMRDPFLEVVPSAEPGMTPAELLTKIKPRLSEAYFPGGAKAGWWMKCVQLDLEAKGVIVRAPKPPVRLRKVI